MSAIYRQGCCAKHYDRRAVYACMKCLLPLCSACAYFTRAKVFVRRRGLGPHCLTCFRTCVPRGSKYRWLAGSDSDELVPLPSSSASEDTLFVIYKSGWYGYVDQNLTLKTLLGPEVHAALDFAEGLAAVAWRIRIKADGAIWTNYFS